MNVSSLDKFQMDGIIQSALKEDIISEDITTAAVCDKDRKAKVSLISKAEGILAGIEVFKRTFLLLDDKMSFEGKKQDGDYLKNGELILEIVGNATAILMAERTALNFLQRMSGIATYTGKCVSILKNSNVKILDTRKTTPNLRIFEKYSVKIGGGYNHRYNLSDGILIKDNHIDAAGSITNAVQRVRAYYPFIKKIEVEVENLDMVKEALDVGADIIMLDNMSIESIKEAVKFIKKRAVIECSGNIDIHNLAKYKDLEIDYVSCGALTNNAHTLDLSMKHFTYIN